MWVSGMTRGMSPLLEPPTISKYSFSKKGASIVILEDFRPDLKVATLHCGMRY